MKNGNLITAEALRKQVRILVIKLVKKNSSYFFYVVDLDVT